jgi:formylglycine-generating enzyme required for sulfatase activity
MNDQPRPSQHSHGDGNAVVAGDINGPLTINNYAAPKDVGPDEAALQRGYLQWVMSQCRPLSLAAIDYSGEDPNVPRLWLDQVYTALRANWQSRSLDEASASSDKAYSARVLVPTLHLASALRFVDANPCAVLLGAPGSGKSTFVNFLALCLAGELLQDPGTNLARLTAPLPDDEGEDQEERQGWSHSALIPVRVILRDFAASEHLPPKGAEPGATALWSHVAQMLERCDKADYLPHLRRRMLAGEAFLLLDGLDEVAEAEQRREQVVGAIRAFAAAHGDARILVTARPYAYQQPRWRLDGFADAALTDFSDGQIRRFIRRWYAGQSSDQADNAGRATLLEQAIFRRDKGRLLALARRPLLLTLMARLHAEKRRELPDKRVELYAEVLDLLLRNWDARRFKVDERGCPRQDQPALSEYLDVGPEAVRAVLERLAFAAHRDQASATDTADITETDLVKALLDINPDNKEIRPRQLMDYLEHRTGVLAPRAPGVYTFPHRSFQEYLAACHLNREDLDLEGFDDEAALIADLGRRDPDRWREVVLLAAANGPRLAWDVADLLLPELSAAGPLRIEDAWGARLAGQILLESTDYAKASPKRVAIRDRIRDGQLAIVRRSSLPAPERAAAGDCLAALGDRRFDPARCYLPAEPLMGFVGIPAGSFTMGSDKTQDEDASDDEQPQHRLTLPTYWIGRWPVTVAQFREFVQSSGYQEHDKSALSGPASRPVAYVTWRDAQAYCDWLDSRLRELVSLSPTETSAMGDADELYASIRSGELRVGLPSEAEWEKAARGSDARRYPWGEPPDTERANYGMAIGETSVVGCYPDGASPFGCEEMSGNVWC